MNGKFFLDTNIFAYCFDSQAREKQLKARTLITQALTNHAGVISFQVVQEFLNIATRKFRTPLSIPDCKRFLNQVLAPLWEIYSSEALYILALDISAAIQYSFYDSLIIAASVQARCKILYTEDLCHQRTVHGVTLLNPFAT